LTLQRTSHYKAKHDFGGLKSKETQMKPPLTRFLIFAAILIIVPAAFGQADVSREKTRERLSALLTRVGPEVKINFQPSTKVHFNFIGWLNDGLTNADKFEIVISVTNKQTISIQVYPHYKGAYINIDKARNPSQLLRRLVQLNYSSFLFWGADETGDVFTGYTFTLESGFPDEAIKVVLQSIQNSDSFVGEMRPSIDGSSAP
jgi:hypothetical protein